MILAQATPSPAALQDFWLVVGFFASILSNLIFVVVTLANRKQKREVSFGFEPVGKTDFERHIEVNRVEHENLFSKIGGVERGAAARLDEKLTEIEQRAEASREKMHTRINRISIGVARLCGKLGVTMPSEDAEI